MNNATLEILADAVTVSILGCEIRVLSYDSTMCFDSLVYYGPMNRILMFQSHQWAPGTLLPFPHNVSCYTNLSR